jgi:uncharacterized repeat protein (TIGR03803 family)
MNKKYLLFTIFFVSLALVARGQLIWTTNSDNTLTITGFNNTAPYPISLSIPSVIDTLSVTSIGSFAFYDNQEVTSVTIPSSVTSIGKLAFEYCGLSSVTIGSGITVIGDNVFTECANLTNVSLPNGVTKIGNGTFLGCYHLANITLPTNLVSIGETAFSFSEITNVVIPESVVYIGSNAFLGCEELSSISVSPSNVTYSTLAGVLFDRTQTSLLVYPQANEAELYNVPNSVTTIASNAFSGCSFLTNITISSNVTAIGADAFYNCGSLTAINVATNNPVYSSASGLLYDKSVSDLIQCPSGKSGSIALPNGVTVIGPSAFAYSEAGSVTMPNSVETIETNAFEWSSIEKIVLSANIANITSNAFIGSQLESITIPGDVTNIAGGAFEYCYYLRSIYFEGNLPVIDSTAFTNDNGATIFVPGVSGASALFDGLPVGDWDPLSQCIYFVTNGAITVVGYSGTGGVMTIPSTIDNLPIVDIASNAFASVSGLTSIVIPSSVRSIDAGAFSGCQNLTNAIVPLSVTNIGPFAFANTGLESFAIPFGITSVAQGCFSGCAGLTNILLPATLTSIGSNAFSYCGFSNVVIPAAVTNLSADAFAGCYALTEVVFEGNAPSVNAIVFAYDTLTAYYLPGATGWGALIGGARTKELAGPFITTEGLAVATNNLLYNQQLTESGGQGPFNWTIVSGALPGGLTLGGQGLISGIPTNIGTFTFGVRVTDSTNGTSTNFFALAVASGSLQIATSWLQGGITTIPYAEQLSAMGGMGPYTWTLASGQLPPGLSLASNGMISGIPTFAGTGTFLVSAVDSKNASAIQPLSLVIAVFAPLQIVTASLPIATNGINYAYQLVATNGQPPYSWSLGAGFSLPGLTVGASGLISGIPLFGGSNNVTLQVTDALSATQTVTLSLASLARVLHTFEGYPSDGDYPVGGMLLNGDTLYGTTYGFEYGYGSSVFKINVDGSGYSRLYSFTNSNDGLNPWAGLAIQGDTLYGTTQNGGLNYGSVFSINTNGTAYKTIHSFTGYDGNSVRGGLVVDGGTLYGTAQVGGSSGAGTVFALHTDGSGFTNLYNFTNGPDGGNPWAGLLLSGQTLYGTTYEGGIFDSTLDGSFGYGTVFAVNTNGTGFATLHRFNYAVDGEEPAAPLALYNGVLYGTTYLGPANGTVFDVNTNGTDFSTLFYYPDAFVGLSDFGSMPFDGLTFVGSTVYGTTSEGGLPNNGTIFAMNADGTGLINLYDFSAYGCCAYTNADGASPYDSVVVSGNTLYTTSRFGGDYGDGTVIALSLAPHTSYSAAPPYGVPSLPVQFAAPSLDSFGNSLVTWNWTFGDGSVGIGQNPLHIFGTPGTYTPVLVATNVLGQEVVAVPESITVYAVPDRGIYGGLVINGDFESGDFSGWTLDGGDDFVDDGSLSRITPYSGNFEAVLGTIGQSGNLYQTLSTTPGSSYLLSFWLNSPDGQMPNDLFVSWNGTVLFEETNAPAFNWTNLQFEIVATGSSTVLDFGFKNDPSYFGLDAVSVTPTGPKITFNANTISGTVPLVVNFTSSNSDSTGNAIIAWNWDFGDGTGSSVQNPIHSYTDTGVFYPSLVATNTLGLSAIGVGPIAITVTNVLVAQPSISSVSVSGENLVLSAANGVLGETYYVLSSTNLTTPLSQWVPVATNSLMVGGPYTIVVSNSVTATIPQRFYTIKKQ